MTLMEHTVEILWAEIWDAFQNRDDELLFFLDRATGEVFAVPSDYSDESFWNEMERNDQQFLPIPAYDYDQERHLLSGFIKELDDPLLQSLLEKSFAGKNLFGRIDDILSFYPEEQEHWQSYRDSLLTSRIKNWLEEHDIYATEFTH